jgi:hypothetical protein
MRMVEDLIYLQRQYIASTLWDENGQISYKSIYKYGVDTPSQTIVLTRFILSATIEWE